MSISTSTVSADLYTSGTYIGQVTDSYLGSFSVLTASVTMDDTAAPYVMADVTCSIPSAALLKLTDPRITNTRVRLNATRTFQPYSNDATQSMYLDLQLRGRSIDYNAQTMTLALGSDEALLMDGMFANSVIVGSSFWGTGNVSDLVGGVINAAAANDAYSTVVPLHNSVNDTVPGGAFAPALGDEYWSSVTNLVEPSNFRVYADEGRTWYMVPDQRTLSSTVALNATDTVYSASDSIDLRKWLH